MGLDGGALVVEMSRRSGFNLFRSRWIIPPSGSVVVRLNSVQG